MIARAVKRRNNNVKQQLSAKLLSPFTYNGSIPLLNPLNHKFRDNDPSKFIGKRVFMNYTYITDAKKSEIGEKRNKELYLENIRPMKSDNQHEFRARDITKIIQPRFRYVAANENERTINTINKLPKIDFERLNDKMIHFPDFRNNHSVPSKVY